MEEKPMPAMPIAELSAGVAQEIRSAYPAACTEHHGFDWVFAEQMRMSSAVRNEETSYFLPCLWLSPALALHGGSATRSLRLAQNFKQS